MAAKPNDSHFAVRQLKSTKAFQIIAEVEKNWQNHKACRGNDLRVSKGLVSGCEGRVSTCHANVPMGQSHLPSTRISDQANPAVPTNSVGEIPGDRKRGAAVGVEECGRNHTVGRLALPFLSANR